ncbi:HTH-type transcriptional regulator YesS [Blautia producta]|uniref:HTH-type transcriptional regulator YesS n=1 Tax=Blautia producta TaxID=33035 RepID=A0A4P6M1L6_9FIRM|nr:AraC family transcriptional regulator [Blautia producta]QBE97353.1 HTH-type transcriptional regulator YesS [Blautia producta]
MFYENKNDYFIISCERTSLQYPLHLHPYIEYVHIIKGKLEMQIGSEKYILTPGDLALIFPNVLHDYHTLSDQKNTQFHIINCDYSLLPYHQQKLLNMTPTAPVLCSAQIHEDVLYAERRLFELNPRKENWELVGSLMSLILCRLFPPLQLVEHSKDSSYQLSTEILIYIAKHYREDISLTSIAFKFGIGKYSLSRIFSNLLKCNFTYYVNSLRISYAHYLLLSTDLNVLEIGTECGYHNQQTFHRVFREFSLCTPKEYRENSFAHMKVNIHYFLEGEDIPQ